MAFEFPCESCSSTLRVDESQVGKKGRCPSCKHVNIVPDPATIAPAAADPGFAAASSPGFAPAASNPTVAPAGNPLDSFSQPAANPYTTSEPAVNYSSPGNSIAPAGGDAMAAFRPMFEALFFIRFVAWVSIISGALACITIVGAVTGWIPLWMGICLRNSCIRLEQGYQNGDVYALTEANRSLSTYFRIMGVMTMISVAFSAMIVLFYLVIIIIGLVAVSAG